MVCEIWRREGDGNGCSALTSSLLVLTVSVFSMKRKMMTRPFHLRGVRAGMLFGLSKAQMAIGVYITLLLYP